MKTDNKTISEFLDSDYRDYATYVLEHRAVPSVIDGFKPVQRKIMHIARKAWRTGAEKPMKVFQLTGRVSADCFYHHGDASLNDAIIAMVQSFKNNIPLLEEVGQFGILRSPDASAPRYIGTKLAPAFKAVYKDFDLLTPKFEEGYEIEPAFFLPIIPTILINGGSGLAVGYRSDILNRSPKEVTAACIAALQGKKFKAIKPRLNNFKGTYENVEDNPRKWVISGSYEKLNSTMIRVTELPPSMTYQKFEVVLEGLVNDKKIKSYDDNSKDNVDYTLRMSREEVEHYMKKPALLIADLKLRDNATEFFTTLDEHGKLKIFESASEIIEYFVAFRLGYYEKRKAHQMARLTEELRFLNNRAAFIKAILDGKLVVNKRNKDDREAQMVALGLDRKDGSYDYLHRMSIDSLGEENYKRILQDVKDKKAEHSLYKASVPADEYRRDLEELKAKLKH